MRSIVFALFLLVICPFLASGQSNGMSALERAILSTLSKDSTSTVVSYMPAGRKFGLDDLSDSDQLIFVKIGREIRAVSHETGFVFGPVSPEGPLTRLDSNKVFGAEYHIDAFARKDTLFMVATSHFLKGKGFLAYYDQTLKDWKPYRGNDAVIKESTRPFYDPKSDQLFLVCNYVYVEPVDTVRASNDHVMRYSFDTGKWDVVGRLETDVYTSATNVPVQLNWTSGFGAGNLEEGDLNVVQPGMNRWMATDSTFRVRELSKLEPLLRAGRLLQLVHMGDSLYAFSGTADSIRVDRLPAREADFTVVGGKALYDESAAQEADEEHARTGFPNWGLVVLSIALVAAVGWWTRSRRVSRDRASAPGVNGPATVGGDSGAVPAMPARKEPVQYFLESLTPVEKSLVLELARYAGRGDMMDTQALNQILGVSHKEPEVQKVRRSLTITRINSNFGQMLAPEEALIRREKDPSDKRVFLYYISPEHARLLMAAEAGPAHP